MGACVSHTGGLPSQWRGNGPPTITAPAGDCPDLEGSYRSEGRDFTSEAKAAVLQQVLGQQLGLTELVTSEGVPGAAVTFSRDGDDWWIKGVDGQAQIKIDGRPVLLDRDWAVNGSRMAGCSDGRLWIGSSSVRTQYESMTQTRVLGVISTTPDGSLLIDVRTERSHYGLWPAQTVQRLSARYRFAPAAGSMSTASVP